MTKAEVLQFVELEIAGRYRKISDAARSDWVRAVWKAGSIELAREIIRGLVDDPNATLNSKAFLGQLKHCRRGETPKEQAPAYVPWILCVQAPADHPSWLGREWVRMVPSADAADKLVVGSIANAAANEAQERHGGVFVGSCRPVGQLPPNHPVLPSKEASEWVREHVLDGPDSPGRRIFLQRQSISAATTASLRDVPPTPKGVCATHEMVERLRNGPAAPACGPIKFDPEHDPELQEVGASHREPGEDPVSEYEP